MKKTFNQRGGDKLYDIYHKLKIETFQLKNELFYGCYLHPPRSKCSPKATRVISALRSLLVLLGLCLQHLIDLLNQSEQDYGHLWYFSLLFSLTKNREVNRVSRLYRHETC